LNPTEKRTEKRTETDRLEKSARLPKRWFSREKAQSARSKADRSAGPLFGL